MAWMVRVMASFGVIEPFEHELGSCAWGKELQLQLGCHRSEELAHCEHAFLRGITTAHASVDCACCFNLDCCFVVDVSLLIQGLRKSFDAAETPQFGMLF